MRLKGVRGQTSASTYLLNSLGRNRVTRILTSIDKLGGRFDGRCRLLKRELMPSRPLFVSTPLRSRFPLCQATHCCKQKNKKLILHWRILSLGEMQVPCKHTSLTNGNLSMKIMNCIHTCQLLNKVTLLIASLSPGLPYIDNVSLCASQWLDIDWNKWSLFPYLNSSVCEPVWIEIGFQSFRHNTPDRWFVQLLDTAVILLLVNRITNIRPQFEDLWLSFRWYLQLWLGQVAFPVLFDMKLAEQILHV